MLLLTGCPTPRGDGARSTTSGSEEETTPTRERTDLTREGVLALGDYLFELEEGEGERTTTSRRIAQLARVSGDELELSIDGAPRRVSRQAAGPMFCLRAPLAITEGDLRIALDAGAPVHVAASDATHARVGPVPRTAFSRVLDRSALSLEGCRDERASGTSYVAATHPGDQACMFSDPDPIDESDGLPIPSGVSLEELDREGGWAHVRVFVPGGSIEGWIASELISTSAPSTSIDWSAAALRPDRCAFPGRAASPAPPRAWIERSDDTIPLPPAADFERTLRDADPRVRGCWDELPIDQRPNRPARVEVRIGIDGDGQVDLAAVVRSENAPASLTRCIAERVRRIRFPPPRTGVTLRRTYAFDPAPVETSDEEL
ncbi:Hypothetical protein I5071_61410 [Sandaracinus amylolyticus]|nr:Hypothetical protein I5071_61410 [Sandaracinus amylolyticus]